MNILNIYNLPCLLFIMALHWKEKMQSFKMIMTRPFCQRRRKHVHVVWMITNWFYKPRSALKHNCISQRKKIKVTTHPQCQHLKYTESRPHGSNRAQKLGIKKWRQGIVEDNLKWDILDRLPCCVLFYCGIIFYSTSDSAVILASVHDSTHLISKWSHHSVL